MTSTKIINYELKEKLISSKGFLNTTHWWCSIYTIQRKLPETCKNHLSYGNKKLDDLFFENFGNKLKIFSLDL